jgi:GR25 family glycosyltransferase involved in LPS biosynthesis
MSNPFDFFDKIYYINLDERTDRKEMMEAQFAKYNLNVERYNAVNLSQEQNQDLIKRGCVFYDDTRPEYAPRIKSCSLSHLNVLFMSKLMSYNNVLIFEDDADFDENIIDNLAECINELKNKNWDVFFLGCNPLSYYKETDVLGRVLRATCAHAFAVNKNFIDKIISQSTFFKHYPCFDGYLGNLGRDNNNKIYMSNKNLVWQRNNFSNIEKTNVDYRNLINNNYKNNIEEKPEGW